MQKLDTTNKDLVLIRDLEMQIASLEYQVIAKKKAAQYITAKLQAEIHKDFFREFDIEEGTVLRYMSQREEWPKLVYGIVRRVVNWELSDLPDGVTVPAYVVTRVVKTTDTTFRNSRRPGEPETITPYLSGVTVEGHTRPTKTGYLIIEEEEE